MTVRLRLARNIPAERFVGSSVPLFDLEEIDDWSLPIRCIAIGQTAERIHEMITTIDGDLDE